MYVGIIKKHGDIVNAPQLIDDGDAARRAANMKEKFLGHNPELMVAIAAGQVKIRELPDRSRSNSRYSSPITARRQASSALTIARRGGIDMGYFSKLFDNKGDHHVESATEGRDENSVNTAERSALDQIRARHFRRGGHHSDPGFGRLRRR
jgi:hypothetical protein